MKPQAQITKPAATRQGVRPPPEDQSPQAPQAPRAAHLPPEVDSTGRPLTPLDIAYHEFWRACEAGAQPDPDEFCAQHPALKSSLAHMLSAHFLVAETLGDGPEPTWPEPGQSFLGYALLRQLGKGAFARVFLAREPMLGNRLVAVKVSRGGASEAHILGRLEHPNIVPVHSVQKDTKSSLSVVCMPYLGSATLCDVLDRAFAADDLPKRAQVILAAVADTAPPGETSPDERRPCRFLQSATYVDGIRSLAVQLADALAFMHARGICHRDLKPSNVLMSPSGTPMLLDFNLSADAAKRPRRLGGTLAYMSPEQLLATAKERTCDPSLLDARSDLFSLGVILFELLAGQHPFGPVPLKLSEQELRQLLLQRQPLGPLSLRQANPAVDKPLARLVERCLQCNPNDRPQSASEIAAALRKGLSRRRRLARWLARHARAVAATLLLCLTLSVTAAYLLSLRAPYAVRQWDRGAELYRQGDYRQALQYFDRALDADPTLDKALFARGRAYQQLGQTDARYLNLAIADYQRVDELKPSGKIKACLGYCHNLIGRPQPAIRYYHLAIEGGWATPEVFNNLGHSFLRQYKLDEAKQSLDRALDLKPEFQAAFHNRALVALQRVQTHAPPPQENGATGNPARIPTELIQCLDTGIADAQQAIRLGPATAALYYDAARLCAVASVHDERWATAGLQYLKQAISRGTDPKRMADDPFLLSLRCRPHFQKLLRTPCAAHSEPTAIRLVDPVDGIPD